MTELNLTTKGNEQERILAYLKENASEVLAEKINNGVTIEKDGKRLINKKTLDGFMKYACDEARKQAAKGANSAMIDDAVVFGWAIHYFEEDSIEGTLYNEDGTEYKPAPKKTATAKPVTPPKPEPKPQLSLFEFMADNKEDEDFPTDEEIDEILKEVAEEERKEISPSYKKYLELKEEYPNHIIAYRQGDFYEVYGDDAEYVAGSLSLTITSRDVGAGNRIPMIGFPIHSAELYFAKITDNKDLIVYDEQDKPRVMKKKDTVIDFETGEILSADNKDGIMQTLREMLGDIFIVR